MFKLKFGERDNRVDKILHIDGKRMEAEADIICFPNASCFVLYEDIKLDYKFILSIALSPQKCFHSFKV